jgi:hypothetical protein
LLIESASRADVYDYSSTKRTLFAYEGVPAMLRQTMIVWAIAAALTGGLSADAFARGGGGGGHGGGFGGGHMGGGHIGGGFGGGHMGGGFGGGFGHIGGGGFGRGFAGSHFAGVHGHFAHQRRFARGFGAYGFDDYGCGYPYYNYYNPYSCYSTY